MRFWLREAWKVATGTRSGTHSLHGPQCGRKWRRFESGEGALSCVEASDQKKPPNLEIARVRGVQTIAAPFERRSRRIERFRRPTEVTRHEGDFCLGDDAACAGDGFFRTEASRGTAQQGSRASEVADLRHRDAPKRQCWRVVAERYSL